VTRARPSAQNHASRSTTKKWYEKTNLVAAPLCLGRTPPEEASMPVVKWEKDGTVAVVTMTNGENRHNKVFVAEVNQTFDEILADKAIKAVILTSNDVKNFSQGIDVAWLWERMGAQDMESVKVFMRGMNEMFKKLLLFPMPVIAAINGHAFGNGAILSCACDFRFMRADKGFFCFPEVDVGIPFLPGMIAFVRKAIPDYKFYELKLTGRRCTAPELEQHHVIVKSCASQEELMQESLAFARTFQKKRGIFGEMKKRLHKGIVQTIDTDDPPFIDSLSLMVSD
jgi:enoyl-CoA hydratase/carnithine racemase